MATEGLEQAMGVAKGVLASVKPDQLDDPTPCKSWKVRDVINHIVGGSYLLRSGHQCRRVRRRRLRGARLRLW